jgi:hypothetical protein
MRGDLLFRQSIESEAAIRSHLGEQPGPGCRQINLGRAQRFTGRRQQRFLLAGHGRDRA